MICVQGFKSDFRHRFMPYSNLLKIEEKVLLANWSIVGLIVLTIKIETNNFFFFLIHSYIDRKGQIRPFASRVFPQGCHFWCSIHGWFRCLCFSEEYSRGNRLYFWFLFHWTVFICLSFCFLRQQAKTNFLIRHLFLLLVQYFVFYSLIFQLNLHPYILYMSRTDTDARARAQRETMSFSLICMPASKY